MFLLFAGSKAFSQAAACNIAQNACSNPSFALVSNFGTGLPGGLNISNPSTNPQNGNGSSATAPPNSGCLLTNGPGPNWMIITAGASGPLGFAFGTGSGPNAQTGFYDWAMWPYDPTTTCNGIFGNTLPPIACCWNASNSGGTGMGPTPPGANAGNFQPSIQVTAGQQFLILLSNYSGVTNNVSLVQNGPVGLTCSTLILPSFIRCPGQQAVMTATWIANVTSPSYTLSSAWPLNASTYTVQNNNPTFVVAPTSTHVYTLYASGLNSVSAVVTTSNTFTVTVSPTTTMNIVASNSLTSMDNGNVCYGTAATFTALSSGTNYSLTGPAPSPTIVSAIATISSPTLSASGQYTLSTTLFSGCTATGVANINVAPNHSLTVTPPVHVCLHGNVLLKDTLPTGSNYYWTTPSGSVINTQNLTLSNVSLTNAGVYSANADINFNGITCHRTATTQVFVVATTPVSITTSPSQTLCQGSNVNLLASITGTAGFLWTGPNGFNTSAQTTTVAGLMPVNAGIYTVTAIFSNGVLSCPITNTVKVNVVATAIPTISLITYNVCQHGTATMSVTTAGSPAYIAWSGPNGFTSSAVAPVIDSIKPVASGPYSVTAYYTMGQVTCPTHVSEHINVVPVSTVSVIPPAHVCRPNNVNLFSSAVNAISYTWVGPNNYLDHQANPVLFHPLVNASGIYTVTVAFGGGALVCYNHNTVSVTVDPILNFSLTPFQQPCYNTPVHIDGPPGATAYNWTSSGGYSSTSPNVDFTHVTQANGGTYTLNVSLGNCVTTQTAVIDVIGRIQEIFSQQDVVICKGDSITLKSEMAGGSSSDDYAFIWTPALYLNSPNIGVQYGVRPQSTTVYNVQAFDTRCPEYRISHNFTVKVLNAARPDLRLELTVGCAPLNLLYDSKVDLQRSIVTYDFMGSNGWNRRIQRDSFNYVLHEPGTYTLRIKTTTLDEESGKVCADSSDYPAPLIVNPKPGADISWVPESPTISENNVTFMASAKNGPVITHKWNFAGTYNDTSDAANQQRLFQYTGKYAVTLTSTNDQGCSDTVVKYVEIKDDFNVFVPNSFTPNGDNLNDVFQLKGTGIKQELFSMDIFDRWGTLMFSTKDPVKGWDGSVHGQLAGEGVYVYKIKLSGANGEGKKEYLGQVTLIR